MLLQENHRCALRCKRVLSGSSSCVIQCVVSAGQGGLCVSFNAIHLFIPGELVLGSLPSYPLKKEEEGGGVREGRREGQKVVRERI